MPKNLRGITKGVKFDKQLNKHQINSYKMQTTQITISLRYASRMNDAIQDSGYLMCNLNQIATDTWEFDAEDMDEHEEIMDAILKTADCYLIPEHEITFGGITE